MSSFEKELQSALARRNPPADFSNRMMAAVGRHRSPPYRSWLAAAAVLVLMLAGVFERERTRRMEAQTAGEKLVRAMEIVNAKLDGARERVVKMGDSPWDTESESQRP